MYNKNQIDESAEREAIALSKQGKRERPRRVKQETSTHSKEKFNKLFRKN